jgi:hypothetical protein
VVWRPSECAISAQALTAVPSFELLLSQSTKARSSPREFGRELLKEEESEEFLAQLDAEAAAADADNKTYTIEETREMVKSVVARAGR